MSRDDGGSAFPGIVERPAGGVPGMSLRDYFAAQALAYLSPNAAALIETAKAHNMLWSEAIAKGCYEIADAMLKERTKG